jgi:hypothetical protein
MGSYSAAPMEAPQVELNYAPGGGMDCPGSSHGRAIRCRHVGGPAKTDARYRFTLAALRKT